MDQAREKPSNRRRDIRLAGGGQVDAVVLDELGYPTAMLDSAKVLNVSAGGIAIASKSKANAGEKIRVKVDAPATPAIVVKALDCSDLAGDRHRIRCQLVEGRMPGRMIHGW